MKHIAHSGIYDCGVLFRFDGEGFLCFECAFYESLDVEAGGCDGKESYRGENRETAAHIVRNDKSLVSLPGGKGFESTLLCIGNGYDAGCCIGLAVTLFDILLDDTEGDGRFGCSTALGDDDGCNVAFCSKVHEFGKIFLGEVVSGEDDLGGVLLFELLCEIVAKGLDDAFCSEVASSDADGNHEVYAFCFPVFADGVNVIEHLSGDFRGEVLPAKEVVACAFF